MFYWLFMQVTSPEPVGEDQELTPNFPVVPVTKLPVERVLAVLYCLFELLEKGVGLGAHAIFLVNDIDQLP